MNIHKRKQNDSSPVDQQSRQERKARASLSLKRGINLQHGHMLTEVSLAAYTFKRRRLRLRMSGLLFDKVSFNITTFVMD